VWGEMCCLTDATQNFNLTLSYSGTYRISVQGIDKELNLSPKYSDVVHVGGATGTPPTASAVVDKLEGVAPLTVNIDMTGSSDPDGSIASYGFYCADGLKTSTSPQSSCIYNDPGTYYLWTTVTDNQGLMDAAKTYITVLPGSSSPPPPPDTTPPSVSFIAPASPVMITGQYTVQVGASDNRQLSLIELFLDNTGNRVASTSVSSTTGALIYKWNTSPKSQKGNHTLIARATD